MSDQQSHFIVPLKYYVVTFVTLLFLTVITVVASRVDLGVLNTPLALGIALVKMSLVVLFFMALRWEKGINPVLFIGAIVCVFIFFLLTFADVAYRGEISNNEALIFDIKSPVKPVFEQSAPHGSTPPH